MYASMPRLQHYILLRAALPKYQLEWGIAATMDGHSPKLHLYNDMVCPNKRNLVFS